MYNPFESYSAYAVITGKTAYDLTRTPLAAENEAPKKKTG